MFSSIRGRDVAMFAFGLFVGAAVLQSLQAQVGGESAVPVAAVSTTYKIPLSPGKAVIYDVETGESRSYADLTAGKTMDVVFLKTGNSVGSSISVDNSVLPNAEYTGAQVIGGILAIVEIPWGTVKEQDCRDATQKGFKPGPFVLTASQTLCGRTTDGAIFALGIGQPVDPAEIVLIGFAANVVAPAKSLTETPAPAPIVQQTPTADQTTGGLWTVKPTAAGELKGTIQTIAGKQQTSVGVDFREGTYHDLAKVYATKDPVSPAFTISASADKLYLSTLISAATTRQFAFVSYLSQKYAEVDYAACSAIASGAESAYATKSPTAFSAFPPNLTIDVSAVRAVCGKTPGPDGYVFKIGNYVKNPDGSIAMDFTVWKTTATTPDPKQPTYPVVAVPVKPAAPTAVPVSGTISFESGKTSAQFNLSTATREPAPKGHVEFATVTTSIPQQNCRKVRSGFRTRTECSTTYRSTTVLQMKALPSFTRIVALPGKAYDSVTQQDCVKAAEDTKKAQPVLTMTMSPASVVCVSSLIGSGLTHAKFDGGMRFTVWKQ